MARITQEQKEENLKKYNQIILDLFLTEGWHAVTYDNIAKVAGVRKSTLQGYYESNKDFGLALKGKIFPVFTKYLDLSSKKNLISSWNNALEHKQFRMIINMLIANSTTQAPSDMTVMGVKNLINMFNHAFDEDCRELVEKLLGTTVLRFLEI